jgi:hypothetical protein
MKLIVSLTALLTFMVLGAATASASTYYVSQNGGPFNGGSACNGQNAISVGTSNNKSYQAGDLIYICGTITSGVSFSSSNGASGNPVTIKFDSGARVSAAMCAAICFNLGGASNLILDGGTPCGPGTPCEIAEASNQTSHPSGLTGIIEATNSGSPPLSAPGRSQGIWTAGNNVEIRNIILRNFYQHTSFNDNLYGSDDITAVYVNGTTNTSIHDSVLHDFTSGVELNKAFNFSFYNNSIYQMNWGIGAGTQAGVSQTGWTIHDNHFGRVDNWDEAANNAHHNRIILFNGGVANGAGNWSGLYIYNNLFDGAAGCCSTGIIFFDGGPQLNTYVYNNVFSNAGQTQGLSNALMEGSSPGNQVFYYNNTIIGAGPAVDNRAGCLLVQGTAAVINNVITLCNQLVYYQNSPAVPSVSPIDYNAYGTADTSRVFVTDSAGVFTSLGAWRSYTKQEANSTYNQSGLKLNVDGTLTSGSPIVSQQGMNLSSVCNQNANLTALCFDSSLGHQRTPTPRPATGSWAIGALNSGSTIGPPGPPPANRPAPPTNLGATVN